MTRILWYLLIFVVMVEVACGPTKVVVVPVQPPPPTYPVTMMPGSPAFHEGPNVAPAAGSAMPVAFWDPDQG